MVNTHRLKSINLRCARSRSLAEKSLSSKLPTFACARARALQSIYTQDTLFNQNNVRLQFASYKPLCGGKRKFSYFYHLPALIQDIQWPSEYIRPVAPRHRSYTCQFFILLSLANCHKSPGNNTTAAAKRPDFSNIWPKKPLAHCEKHSATILSPPTHAQKQGDKSTAIHKSNRAYFYIYIFLTPSGRRKWPTRSVLNGRFIWLGHPKRQLIPEAIKYSTLE